MFEIAATRIQSWNRALARGVLMRGQMLNPDNLMSAVVVRSATLAVPKISRFPLRIQDTMRTGGAR
jgi:hypothetical protein